jgi:hypothetical protein
MRHTRGRTAAYVVVGLIVASSAGAQVRRVAELNSHQIRALDRQKTAVRRRRQ